MAKRLNKNLVLGLTAVAFLVLTVTGVLMVQSLGKADPKEHAAKAEGFAKDEDYQRARTHLMRAFRDSEDPQYLVRAGDMAQLEGEEQQALGLWSQAVTLNPDLIEAHEKLLDFYIPAGWSAKILEAARAILRTDEKHPKALHAEGLALIRLVGQPEGDREEGLKKLELARELAPEVYEYSATLVRSYWAEAAEVVDSDPTKARERITASLDLARSIANANAQPGEDAANARTLYASRLSADLGTEYTPVLLPAITAHLGGKDRFAEAERLYQEAVQMAGDDPEVVSEAMTGFAAYWFERGQVQVREEKKREAGDEFFTKASDWARKAVEANRTGFSAYQLLAQVYSNRQEHLEAAKVCEDRMALPIERKGMKAARAKANRRALLLFAAEQYIAAASSVDRGTPEFEEIVRKADQHVLDAQAEFPDPERAGYALHIRGKIKVVEGKTREALALFEKADSAPDTPRWQNKRWLGILQAQLEQFGAAREALLEAVNDPRADYTTWLTLSKVYAHFDDYHAALRAVDEALKRFGTNQSEALQVKSVVLQKLGRDAEANAIMQGLAKGGESKPIFSARLLASQGKYEEAFALIGTVLAEKPTSEPALRDMIQYAEKLGKRDEARAFIQKAREAEPNNLAFESFDLALDESLSEEQRAARMFELIQKTPDEYTKAARLAQYYRAKNQPLEALEQFSKAVDLIVKEATPGARQAGTDGLTVALQGQFVIALDQKLWDKAEAAVQLAAERNIDGANGNTYRGKYHLAKGTASEGSAEAARLEWDKAAEAFKLALVEQPTDSDSLTWLAECHFRADRVTEAKDCFSRAADINPSNFRAQLRLAEMALREGQTEEFRSRLAQAKKLNPEDPWVKAQDLAVQEEKNPQEGIVRREAMYQENPEDMDNVQQLARLHAAAGNFEKAGEYYDIGLANPAVSRRVVWPAAQFFLRTGDAARALKVLSNAVDAADTPEVKAAFMMMTGALYRQMQNTAESDRQFRSALDLSPSASTYLGFADQHLETGRTREALPWLEKAIEAADKESTPQADPARIRRIRIETLLKLDERDEARAAVNEYATLYPKDPTVYFLSSEVDFAFGEGEKAITSLTRYVEQFPNNPNALYRRAQLYGNMWKWQSAISDLEKLRASSPDALAYSPRLLLALAYDLVERSDLALSELKTLYEQHPDNERICREFLNYYLKHERYAETLTLATALVNRQPDYELWYRFQGQAAMKLEDGAKALESFTKAVELSNLEWRNVSALMEAYSYFKNFEPGIRFYEDQVSEDKRVPPLICRYADLLAGAGRQEEAIAAYREALSSPGAYGDELFVQEVAAHAWQHLGKRPALDMFKVEPAEERLKRPNSHLVASLLYYADYRTESLAALDALLATAGSDEERAGLLARKAVLLEAEKEHESARGVYEEAVKLNPKNFVALNNLAYLLSDKLGKPTDAVPYAERAAEISGQPQVIDTLGWCRVQTGDASAIRQAIGDFSKALLLDPQFVPGHYHRAEAYRRDGRLDEAISGYEAALKLIAQTTNPEYLAFKEPAEKGLEKARAGDKSP